MIKSSTNEPQQPVVWVTRCRNCKVTRYTPKQWRTACPECGASWRDQNSVRVQGPTAGLLGERGANETP